MRAVLLKFIFGAIFMSIIYVPLGRAVAEEIFKNPLGVTFHDETGLVLNENQILNVAWIVIDAQPVYDLTQVGEPEVAMDVIVRKTAFDVNIDDADFYWDDSIWTLEQLKANIASRDFMPGLLDEPQF